jgi:hypothetical protein
VVGLLVLRAVRRWLLDGMLVYRQRVGPGSQPLLTKNTTAAQITSKKTTRTVAFMDSPAFSVAIVLTLRGKTAHSFSLLEPAVLNI